MKVTAEQYGDICDVIYRTSHGMPMISTLDPHLHTSKESRVAASLIIVILGLDIEDPSEITR